MVVRIHNVGKWSLLKAGDILQLSGEHRRKVRLEINCEAPTRLDVIEGERGTFLAVVQGLETIEFSAGAEAHLVATSEGEVWYFTNDGDQIAAERPEAVSFTTIAGRRSRNPELELMMFKMQQNIDRRMEHLASENEALRVAMEAATPHDPETGEVTNEDGDGTVVGDTPAPTGAATVVAEPAPSGQGASAKPGAVVPPGPAGT